MKPELFQAMAGDPTRIVVELHQVLKLDNHQFAALYLGFFWLLHLLNFSHPIKKDSQAISSK